MPGKLVPALSWRSAGLYSRALIHFSVGLSTVLFELPPNMVTNFQEYVFEKTGRGRYQPLKAWA